MSLTVYAVKFGLLLVSEMLGGLHEACLCLLWGGWAPAGSRYVQKSVGPSAVSAGGELVDWLGCTLTPPPPPLVHTPSSSSSCLLLLREHMCLSPFFFFFLIRTCLIIHKHSSSHAYACMCVNKGAWSHTQYKKTAGYRDVVWMNNSGSLAHNTYLGVWVPEECLQHWVHSGQRIQNH